MKVTVSKRLTRLATIKAGRTFCIIESAIPHYYMRITKGNLIECGDNYIPVVELSTGVTSTLSEEAQVLPIDLKVVEDYEDLS